MDAKDNPYTYTDGQKATTNVKTLAFTDSSGAEISIKDTDEPFVFDFDGKCHETQRRSFRSSVERTVVSRVGQGPNHIEHHTHRIFLSLFVLFAGPWDNSPVVFSYNPKGKMVHHPVELKDTNRTIVLYLRPHGPNDLYKVMLGKGHQPNKTHNILQVELPDAERMASYQSSASGLAEEWPYMYAIPADLTTENDTYHVGVELIG